MPVDYCVHSWSYYLSFAQRACFGMALTFIYYVEHDCGWRLRGKSVVVMGRSKSFYHGYTRGNLSPPLASAYFARRFIYSYLAPRVFG